MASVGEGDCHKDPNFAVVCSFLDKYGASLGLEPISYSDLQKYIEDTTGDVSRVLIDIHVRLLRRIGKSIVNSDRFEKCIIKFCHHFSEFDAWEVESYGYKHAQLGTKLRILKNLLECQFDYNLKFKEKINGLSAEEMRVMPIGRDKEGQAYWYFLDHDFNLLVYKEEQDDEDADTWKLICSNRHDLVNLVSSLQKKSGQEEDDMSISGCKSSKEGSPDKDIAVGNVKVKDMKAAHEQLGDVKEERTKQEQAMNLIKEESTSQEQAMNIVKEERTKQEHAMDLTKEESTSQEKAMDIVKEERTRQEQAMDLTKEERTRQEQAMDLTKEERTRQEHAMDIVKEERARQTMGDIVKEERTGQEQIDNGKKKKKMKKQMDVVKKNQQEQDKIVNKEKKSNDQIAVVKDEEKVEQVNVAKKRINSQKQNLSKSTPIAIADVKVVAIKLNEKVVSEFIASNIEPRCHITQNVTVRNITDSGGRDCVSLTSHCQSHVSKPLSFTENVNENIPTMVSCSILEQLPQAETKNPQYVGITSKRETQLEPNLDVEQRTVIVSSSLELQETRGESTHEERPEVTKLSSLDIELQQIAKTALLVDYNQADGTSSDVEVNKAEGTTSNVKVNQTEKCKVTSDVDVNQAEKCKVTSGVEVNQAEGTTGDAEVNQAEGTTEDIEVNQTEKCKVTSDVEVNQAEGTSSDVEVNQAEKCKLASDVEVNQAEGTSSDVKVNQAEKCKLASDVEVNQAEGTSSDVEVNQAEKCKVTSDVEVNQAEKCKVTSDVEVNQAGKRIVISDVEVSNSEKREQTSDIEVNSGVTPNIEVNLEEKIKVTSDAEVNQAEKSEVSKAEVNLAEKCKETSEVEGNSTENCEITSDVEVNSEEKIKVKSDIEICHAEKSKLISDIDINHSEVATEVEANQADKSKVTSDVEVNEAEKSKIALDVEVNKADKSKVASEVEVNQADKSKVASEVEVNQADKSKVTTDVEVNEEKSKVASDVEVNQSDKSKVASDVEVNQSNKSKVTSDVEVNQSDKSKVTSDVEVNQADKSKVASDVEVNQSDKSKVTSDVEVNQADKSKVTSEVEVNQADKSKVASDIEVNEADVEVNQADKSKVATEVEVNEGSEIKVTSNSDVNKTEKSKVATGNEVKKAEKSEVTTDIEVKKAEMSKLLADIEVKKAEETNVTSHVEVNVRPSSDDEKVKLMIVSNVDDEAAMDTYSQSTLDSSQPSAGHDSCDSLSTLNSCRGIAASVSLDIPEYSPDTVKKSHNVERAKPSLLPSSKLKEICDKKCSEGCEDSGKKADETSVTCEQLEPASACSSNVASVDSVENLVLKVEKQNNQTTVTSSRIDSQSSDGVTTQPATFNNRNQTQRENVLSSSESLHSDHVGAITQQGQLSQQGCSSLISCDSNVGDKQLSELPCDSNAGEKQLPELPPCDKSTLDESNATNSSSELGKELSLNKQACNENVNFNALSDTESKDTKKSSDLVNGRTENISIISTEVSVNIKDRLQCDDDNEDNNDNDDDDTAGDKFFKYTPVDIIKRSDLPVEECKNISVISSDVSNNCQISEVNETPKTLSRRKLKRPVPEPVSGEQIDSEPNGKRARQTTKTQKTRRGRNAAAQSRAVGLAGKDTESDDSEIPLSQVREQGMTRGSSRRQTRSGTYSRKQANNSNKKSAIDDDGEEGNNGKRGKKKKPDSSSEALTEEEATPAKKGRNQTQPSSVVKPKIINKKKEESVAKKSCVEKPASVPAAEEETSGIRRSLRVRQLRARRPPTPSSPSDETEDSSEDEDSDEEEEDHDNDFLDASFTPEEESGDEEFKPKGRNFQRQAARTSKEEAEEVVNDDTPCLKCGKYNHPEMILLCDKCDAGYHTACLRPPLMLIPDGDWFCPPCEHSKLVDRLLECLQTFDTTIKKRDRLNKRQERLAFVGISISNILHGERKLVPSVKFDNQGKKQVYKKEEDLNTDARSERLESRKQEDSASTSSYESEQSPKHMYRSERLAQRQTQKRSCKVKHREKSRREKHMPKVEELSQRACRSRGAVSYQFKEFDELISSAIEDDKPCRREKPPGISRGKDMSNILGASDEEEEKIRQRDGDCGQPPPVVKKKCRRRLTRLDSDDDPDEDDSDEFQLSEEDDSDASEGEGEEDVEDEDIGSSDSGDWRPQKTWYNSHASSRTRGRTLRNFVIDDEDYNSDENASKRRSTRNSNRGRIHYSDWDSNEEETEEEVSRSDGNSDNSFSTGRRKSQKLRATQTKKKVVSRKMSTKTDSDSSITIKRKNLRKIIKRKRKDETDSEDSETEAADIQKKEQQTKKIPGKLDSEESDFVLDGDESPEDSDDSPKFKKKNVLRSSDEEDDDEQSSNIDLNPIIETAQTTSNTGCNLSVEAMSQVEAITQMDAVSQVETLPVPAAGMESQNETAAKSKPRVVIEAQNEATTKINPRVVLEAQNEGATKINPRVVLEAQNEAATKINPRVVLEAQNEATTKSKPRVVSKGKKRTDGHVFDKVTVTIATDIAVPDKVRRVSSSDREPYVKRELISPLPMPEIIVPDTERNNQEQTQIDKQAIDVKMHSPDHKAMPVTGGKDCDTVKLAEKTAVVGKKKTVPNFLDVNSGEESDEQRQDQHKDTTTSPSYNAEVGNVQTTVLPQASRDDTQARLDYLESQSQHRNFSNSPGHNFQFNPGSYSQGRPPFSQHHQVMVSSPNLVQVRHDSGPPAHNSNMQNTVTHNGPPGLIRGFSDSMTRHSGTGSGNTAVPSVRVPSSFTGRGPRPNSGHPFHPGLGHSPQGLEPGQSVAHVNHEHHMSHPSFQSVPVSAHTAASPGGGHARAGMLQQRRGGMRQTFFMNQQHEHPNMESDPSSNLVGYIPQSYGALRMSSGQDLGATRNAYYGMQSSPPHSMGQHLHGQYPVNMTPGAHSINSPLTSMGQMTRNLGSGSNMHSSPNAQTMGTGEERRSSLGSPQNQEIIHRQEKITEMRDVRTEGNVDDSPGKNVGKAVKKRAVNLKSKKKVSETNTQSHGLNHPLKQEPGTVADNQGPMAALTEAKDRVSDPGQIIGGYRATSQPYQMSAYQLPYSHDSMSNSNPQQESHVSYMNPKHTPPVLAQHGSSVDGSNRISKDGDAKWNRTENTDAHSTVMSNMSSVEQRLKISYQQDLHKIQTKGQTVASLERRHKMSPVHQVSDLSAVDHSQEPPSAKQINIRTQDTILEANPHSHGLPPPSIQTSEISPNSQDCIPRSVGQGQRMSSAVHDHTMRASSHGHNLPPYTQASGMGTNTSEMSGPYYGAGSYCAHYGPTPGQSMSQNSSTWSSDIQGYGSRYGSQVYPYSRNPTNVDNRMSAGKSSYVSQGTADQADVHVKGPATASQDSSVKDDAVNKTKVGEQPDTAVNRRSSSSDYQMTKSTESAHIYQKSVEADIKPSRRHSDAVKEEEEDNLSSPETHRSQPLLLESVPPMGPTSVQTTMVPQMTAVMTSASVSKHSTQPSSFQHNTSSHMNQLQQVPPVTSMAPHNTWPRTSSAVQYSHQHMAQWPNMGGPGQYGVARPYGGPVAFTRSPYGMDSQVDPNRPNPGHVHQKSFMHQNYDLRFQSSHPGMRPGGPETEYHRSGYSQDYSSTGRFSQQFQSCARGQDDSSHQVGHRGDAEEQNNDGNTVSKPKRAKTNKKTSKDGTGSVRGKSGRGRGRGGFMIDNLLQARRVEVDGEQEDSTEINDIVSYVTTDEYFKQQTSSSNLTHQTSDQL